MKKHKNELAEWLRLATPEQRERAGRLAGTSVQYFYQLASGHRQCPRADKAFAMEDAFHTLHEESAGLLPVITARQIANMAALKGL